MSDAPREFTVGLRVDGDQGVLEWAGQVDSETLERAVSLAADDGLIGRELNRIEVSIPADDHMAMRALHRAGFRREGRRRQAVTAPDGVRHDVLIYARLASDQVYGPGGFSAVMDSVLPTKRVIGHVVFIDADDRVLLLETSYKSDWELPGGVVEPGEPPVTGAEREVHEELGFAVRLGAPRLVDWMPPSLGWSDAIEFIWHGGTLSADLAFRLPDAEIRAYHWVRPDEVASHVSELSARRIALVLDRPRSRYTEAVFTVNGVPLA